mmetsp:Transcript_1605/g.7431  ORF Transcript_1605/g.7431 Transcript_1605/m.7431 type:complete len:273 (+) Transcript_1605:190-1008(+)
MDLLSSCSLCSACCFRRRSSMVRPAPSGNRPSSPSSSSRSTLSCMSLASTAATPWDQDWSDSDVAKGCESLIGRPAVAFGSRLPFDDVVVTGIHGGISPSSRGLGGGTGGVSPSRCPPYHPLPSRPLRSASVALYLSAAVSRMTCSVSVYEPSLEPNLGDVDGRETRAAAASFSARSIASAAARSRSISAASCARTAARSAASSALVRSAAASAARRISSASRAAISSFSAASALARTAAIRCVSASRSRIVRSLTKLIPGPKCEVVSLVRC